MPGMNMGNIGMTPGMFGGFGGPGMGMDGLNMGMGFNANQNGYMGWNGQPGWNTAQDNFNPMTNGIGAYGSNAGYHHPVAGGYNHFNSMTPQQYPNNNFQGNHFQGQGNFQRGRGRGLGRGRGDYGNYAAFQAQSTSSNAQQQIEQSNGVQSQIDPAQKGQNKSSTDAETGKEISTVAANLDQQADDSSGNVPVPQGKTSMDVSDESIDNINTGQDQALKVPETVCMSDEAGNVPVPENGTVPPRRPAALAPPEYAHDFAGRGRGTARGGFGFRGRGSNAWNGVVHPGVHAEQSESPFTPTESLGQGVVGAPTAPKALREGFPNTGYRRGGFGIAGGGGITPIVTSSTAKPKR
jgi:hypothetical protein